MQFNNRNSAYRNIRFNFDGTIKQSVFVFILLPLFTILTLGFALPYMMKRIAQFSVAHSYFGSSKFEFHATTGGFYKIYLKALLIPLIIAIIGIVAAVAIPAYNGYITAAQTDVQTTQQEQNAQIEALEQWSQSSEAEQWPQSDENNQSPLDTTNQSGQSQPYPQPGPADAVAVFPLIITMAFYVLIGVYIQTRTANLILSSTTLEQHELASRLRVRNMFYIHLTNIFAAILSLGLLIPWCKIRLARYRFKNMAFIAHGDINNFIADKQNDVKATASEFADAFDVDLGF